MKKKIQKIGNSQGITLPLSLLREVGINLNSEVEVHAENGRVIMEPIPLVQPVALGGLWNGTKVTEEDIMRVRSEFFRPYRK
ncbi:MAG: AbrB/MazE/SpoVT family DNA-binding domain-containing protein [Deltaproteobacteria bacterium]|nr:MAG: AbrB/MazE/SpoVT family DNA-binding domain-containing protein [Deltaproteobacteria bacterium]